jgi:hypothetical protein
MLPDHAPPSAGLEALLDQVHWNYASEILRAAEFCARNEGLYPVFITSFKCAPDSFIQEYLERVMDGADKPYLTLQLDEHDSSVGYETRIEAAHRSFPTTAALLPSFILQQRSSPERTRRISIPSVDARLRALGEGEEDPPTLLGPGHHEAPCRQPPP